jgi:predicted TIM-barrel fold metal-dependent hydrolase
MEILIDGGCFAGHDPETGFDYPIERVVSDFDRFGVSQGLVGSYRCLYQDVREGNREAARWAARFPGRVAPLAILHPAYYGASPDELLGWLRNELGFGVVALFNAPAYYPVEWGSPAVRRVGEAAAGFGLALQAGIRTEAELAAVARAWGDLPVPVMIRWMGGHRYKVLASELAVARRCRTMVFDVGTMSSIGMIEHAVATVGADRLFLASNSPHHLPACPHAMVYEATLTDEERAMISGGTLRNALRRAPAGPTDPSALTPDLSGGAGCHPPGGVLQGAPGLPGGPHVPASVYDTSAWRELCAHPKVDVHWHPDSWNLGEPALGESDQIATFERYGYERVVGSAIRALNDDLDAGHAALAAWCERDERRFGYIVVNPRQGGRSLKQIARYADHPRFVGLKTIQDLYGMGLDDPLYEPLLQQAAARQLPVLAHLPGMERTARRHPEVRFIAAHATWGRAQALLALPNVSFDFATGHALRDESQLGRFIEAAGAARVLFGSDGPLVSPAWSLGKLLDAQVGAAALRLILRDNAYRLFPKLSLGRRSDHGVPAAHAVLR